MIDTDNIFLINAENKLERVPHSQYESEGLLQALLEEHPELLVGDQINPDDPPRWIVVSREAGIPDSEGASDRWSVDHLLLDQYARPTFVEVKRSSDTRIRREVVGQMMDYAANALAYWPQDRIRALAAENLGGVEELDTHLADFLGLDDPSEQELALESYWKAVEKNLREGEVRLLFVADSIPTELRRIIEFLNEHMPRVEVLGVEIRQYEGQDVRALVPRVIGQTESARQQKTGSGQKTKKTTQAEFLAGRTYDVREFCIRFLNEAEEHGYSISWGSSAAALRLPSAQGGLRTYFYLWPHSSGFAVLDAYLKFIDDPKAADAVREALIGLLPLETKGEHTLGMTLDEEGIKALGPVLDAVLEIPRRLY